MKKFLALFLIFCLSMGVACPVGATNTSDNTNLGLTSKSAILMEASTGTVIYEHNADERLSPASITKIMTLILIFEALENGKIQLNDEVTTSAYAKSMGGSQVFLEEGEKQTVETLIKCIVIASGNDASVAMAEYICGSEEEFVNRMNQKAAELGMTNTNFEDCCGLTDSANHYMSARDVAIMSRELSVKYPKIHEYSTIWMESIVHNTRQGSEEFVLSNTNKLLRQYDGCTGLKTGSTSTALYCLSATAVRNDIELIAVIMAAPESKVRFSEAASLLNYGFSNCTLYTDDNTDILPDVPVKNGVAESVKSTYKDHFTYLSTTGENLSEIQKDIKINDSVEAPVKQGDVVGEIEYFLNGKMLGSMEIIACEDIDKAGYLDYFKKVIEKMFR